VAAALSEAKTQPGDRDRGREPATASGSAEPERPPLALSSMWHQRFPDPGDLGPFLAAGHDMGFTRFELSHDLPSRAIAPLAEHEATFASIHHPCPRSSDHDARDHACHPDAERRARFVAGMRRTIDTAGLLCASAVVVHLGSLEDSAVRRAAFEVASRNRAGQTELPAYQAALDRLRLARERAETAVIEGARSTLAEIVEHAASRGVKIGLETGFHPWEAPSPQGMARLLAGLDPASATLGAWLDTGHAAARATIGLDPWQDWREAVAGRWIGAHFHDIVGLRDHLAPGAGALDFKELGSWLPPAAHRTLEVDWYLGPDEVRAGAEHLVRCDCASWVA